jgi:acetate kinase
MNILVINCGSSSLKFQLIDSETEKCIAKGICERIGIEGSQITYTPAGGEKEQTVTPMPDHTEAIRIVLEALTNPKTGVVKSLDEIGAVGHRIVHGGEKFAASTIITDEVMKAIEECNDLAPLHNPANLIGINACKKLMPTTPMVAVFDTAGLTKLINDATELERLINDALIDNPIIVKYLDLKFEVINILKKM